MATRTVSPPPILEYLPVSDDEADEHGNVAPRQLKRKWSLPIKQRYPNKEVEELFQDFVKLKEENSLYKRELKWILRNIGHHTMGRNVSIGNNCVVIDNGEGVTEVRDVIEKFISKMAEDHAAMSREVQNIQNVLECVARNIQSVSLKGDKTIQATRELLDIQLQPAKTFIATANKALGKLEKWSKRQTQRDISTKTMEDAPKEAHSIINFVATKCVNSKSRKVLNDCLKIPDYAIEDSPSNEDLCFRGVTIWNMEDPVKHSGDKLWEISQEIYKASLTEETSKSVESWKVTSDDLSLMDDLDAVKLKKMYRNIEDIHGTVSSTLSKLNSLEERYFLKYGLGITPRKSLERRQQENKEIFL